LPYSIYRFEAFELRPYERVLYRDQLPTSVGARAVDVLSVLVAAQGRLVSKAELLERVWPGLVVEENNLQVQISALRKQLGAQAIATVPGRGYRFCQPVEAELDHVHMPPAPGARPASGPEAALSPVQRPGRLPATCVDLLGREADLASVQTEGMQPLLTVVGQAGMGKTALAMTLAQAWRNTLADGAVWVELAGVSDPDLVVSVVAQALGLNATGADPARSLAQALAPLQLLLFIDNAEHLLDPVARLARTILQEAPQVCMLVTSQLPLRVEGERVHRLGPLGLPAPGDTSQQALNHGAVALFVKQVHALHRPFELDDEAVACIVRLCRRLDGVPLAIKLAAARVPVLGLQGVEERLCERFKLLQARSGAGPARQHALLAALDWSHELLSASEQAVFRRMAVAAGGFSIDLARQLTRDIDADEWAVIDTLADLVDRSLVVAEGGEWPRYRMLESMRDYAGLKLAEADELSRTRQGHAQAMSQMMDLAWDAHWREADAPWTGLYSPDLDNVRAALDWASQNDPGLAVGLVGAAAPLFATLGLAPEARQRALALQAEAERAAPSLALARYWLALSRLHWGVAAQPMHDMARQALRLYEPDPDDRGRYLALACMAASGVLSLDQSWQTLKDMAMLEQPHWPARLSTQRHLAEISVLKGSERMADARRVCRSLVVCAQSAGLEGVAALAMADLAEASLAMGDLDTAHQTARALLDQPGKVPGPHILQAQAVLACVCIVRHDLPGARAAMAAFITASASRGWEGLSEHSPLFALLAALEGRLDAAARLLGHAQANDQAGVHKVLTVYAHSRASALVQDGLEPNERAQLLAMGQGMAPETVAAWALDHPPPALARR
jgi:predicted ATPase/DNA-binding winged helix-turn-helix (wHTH) protein